MRRRINSEHNTYRKIENDKIQNSIWWSEERCSRGYQQLAPPPNLEDEQQSAKRQIQLDISRDVERELDNKERQTLEAHISK